MESGHKRHIELISMKTMLSGYATSQPFNKKAKEIEMTIFVSLSGEQILEKMVSGMYLGEMTRLILKDLIKYFIGESKGHVVQKMNAALGFVLVVIILVFLGLIILSYYSTKNVSMIFLVVVISSTVCLFITLPLCAKYTRHRYWNLRSIFNNWLIQHTSYVKDLELIPSLEDLCYNLFYAVKYIFLETKKLILPSINNLP